MNVTGIKILILAVFSIAAAKEKVRPYVLCGWHPSNRDSVYYLSAKYDIKRFESQWGKLHNSKNIYAACGFTYTLHELNQNDSLNSIANINVKCGSIETNKNVYYGQLGSVRYFLKNAGIGKIKHDTILDTSKFNDW